MLLFPQRDKHLSKFGQSESSKADIHPLKNVWMFHAFLMETLISMPGLHCAWNNNARGIVGSGFRIYTCGNERQKTSLSKGRLSFFAVLKGSSDNPTD